MNIPIAVAVFQLVAMHYIAPPLGGLVSNESAQLSENLFAINMPESDIASIEFNY